MDTYDSYPDYYFNDSLMFKPPPTVSPTAEPEDSSTSAVILYVTGVIGMVGNFAIMATIMGVKHLRRASNAFLFHHSFIDFLKASYCMPFAGSLISHEPPYFCDVIGGSYVVFITTSSFNLLAMVMNEGYQFSDATLGLKDSRNYCCVIFGIFMLWMTSFILNLGVAFIPGSPSFNNRIGHCMFVYGIARNYVLHVLWIFLVSLAIVLTFLYFRQLYSDIRRTSYYRFTTLLRATLAMDTDIETPEKRRASISREKHHVKQVQKTTLRKLWLLLMQTFCYIVFWYPLFVLTLIDPKFKEDVQLYKILTILAWSNPVITPFIFLLFIRKECHCQSHLTNDSYDVEASTAGPSHEPVEGRRWQQPNSGIYNDFFTRDVDAEQEQLTPMTSQPGPSVEVAIQRPARHKSKLAAKVKSKANKSGKSNHTLHI